jgi:xylose isomerase
VAAALIESGELERLRAERYAGWDDELGRSIISGTSALDLLAVKVLSGEIDPRPVSGRQELLENIVNRAIWSVDRAAAAAGAPVGAVKGS